MQLVIGLLTLSVLAQLSFADLLVSRGTFGVDRYSEAGTFAGTFISPGTGGLEDARGVAVAPDGSVLVADFGTQQILRFDANGMFLNVFAGPADVGTPFDIEIGPDGNLYLGGNLDDIRRFNAATGAFIDVFADHDVPLVLGGPHYISFGPTELAVTDLAGHLFRFNALTGAFIEDYALDNPSGIDQDAAGNLFIAQRFSGNVLRQAAGGGALPEFIPNPNSPDAAFPNDVLILGGTLYVAMPDEIRRYDISGGNAVFQDGFGEGGRYLAEFEPVPEPGTLILGAIAAAALLLRRASIQ